MKYNENGRSMVEMLGVLAIIGVLSVGGIAGYSKAMNKYKINKTTDQVSMLVANIRTLFSSQGNYKDLDNAEAIKFGVVPNDMIKTTEGEGEAADTTSLANAFGGVVTIESSPARTAEGDDGTEAFVITYGGLTSEACVTIATGDWGSGQASGLIAIAAGSGDAKAAVEAVLTDDASGVGEGTNVFVAAPGASATANKTPMAVSKAVTACDGTGSTNSVAWKYY